MIRVAEVLYEPAHSGQAVHVLALAEHLDRSRFSLVVCYPAWDYRMRDRLAELGVEGRPWPMRRWINFVPAMALCRLIRSQAIDILHVHGQFAGLWARPAAKLVGASVVYTPHTIYIRQKRLQSAYWLAERLLGRLTDRLISVCEADRRLVVAAGWIRDNRAITVHNGLDWSKWDTYTRDRLAARRKLGWPADQPSILQIGRLDAQKAPADLLEVATLVRNEMPAVHFYLAGDGPLRHSLETRIHAAGLAETVILLGQRFDVPTLLAACDLVTLTSAWEGLPYSLLEAAAMGRPAVCTAVDGCPEVVFNGETGYTVPPGKLEAMAQAILRLLKQPNLAEEMGRLALTRARQSFDVRRMVNAIATVYEEVIAERKKSELR